MSDDQTTIDASIGTFTSALIFNGAVGAAVFLAFGVVRHWSKKVYQPRTYLVNEDVRSPELPTGMFSWITASFSIEDNVLVERIGLDAYMFVRFLRMAAILFTGFTLVAIPILIPINVVGGLGSAGLPVMTIGNVAESWRFWFHLFLTILFSAATIAMLWKEMQEYTRRRHAYLLSEKHAKTPQSTTILVTTIPKGLNTEEALYNIFNRFPGGVRSIWLNKNPTQLINLCAERDQVTLKLEAAECDFIRSAYVAKSKKNAAIKEPERPVGRTSSIPFVGPKVDLIDFYTKRLAELNHDIEQIQQEASSETLNSAFIQFHTQFAAHSAVQTVVYPGPFRMTPMFVEISPLDVIWDHMNLDIISRKGRRLISLTAATALVLLWSIPVVFVSGIANIDSLVSLLPFLAFVKNLPIAVVGIIQGVLPPLFLAILMALLPIILTMMSMFEGHARYSSVTLAVMAKYFFFLIVNVLLLSTISNGFMKTFATVKDQQFSPIGVLSIIGDRLPGASTFFVTYALLQGFTGPVMVLLQIGPLVINYVFTKLLAKNPRQIWNVQGRLGSVNFGVLFPPQTLMFAIGLLYSTIAPLILPFVAFYFTMYYWVYRHMFLYVYQQPVETGGLAFPVAVQQSYTGLFIFELTMFAIFLLKEANPNIDAVPHVVLMLILIIVTGFSLSNLNEAFDPLVTYLPVALFSEDLQVAKDGSVIELGEKSQADDHLDIEAATGEKGRAVALENLSKQPSEKASLAVSKQEYDESAEISSQMPAVPTPNPSEIDSISFSRQHPSGQHRERPVSYAPSRLAQEQDVSHEDEDPELRRLQEQAYLHPAIYSRQMPIWLPVDERGLTSEEITKLSTQGIITATTGAGLDIETAKAHVSGILFAPGEESAYRLERGV
ncbi:hypothetical protein EDD21DRAFT_391816 [Dissophora ornata]|nr:hypothetical protein BGZ58_010989 [Dissophora ornata]KAI8595204.1 hypothetical protein EDD21DRAFT_391816 [Dissophora ornata]